jgi:hypothetical protein
MVQLRIHQRSESQVEYRLVALVSTEGVEAAEDNTLGYAIRPLVGYAIRRGQKLEGTNIYTPGELAEAKRQVAFLNEAIMLKMFWPLPTEPEVQLLLNDPSFEPPEFDEIQVPDMENSTLVYDVKPGPQIGADEFNVPIYGPDEVKYDETGLPQVNWMSSTIVYKTVREPRGTDLRKRVDMACEIVARARVEEAYAA